MRGRNSVQQALESKLRSHFLINNPAIADGIVSWLFSLAVRSKKELNHWAEDWANHRVYKDWVNNSWLVDHPGSDQGAGISAEHTALLTMINDHET